MHQHDNHLSTRQSVLFEKWRKLQTRIQRKLDNGSFHLLGNNKQRQLLRRLKRYHHQLQRLGFSLKRVVAGTALALALSLAAPTQAQVFMEQTGMDNPFDGVNEPFFPKPTLVDIDADGDLDAFVGINTGAVSYFENTGTDTSPAFSKQTGAANPFDGVDVGYYATPTFVDIDNDGDFDAFVGTGDGGVKYFENTGTNASPVFMEQTGMDNPFDGVDVFLEAGPSFVDIDADGDFDAFIGGSYGTVFYFENTGTNITPTFTELTGADNPLNNVVVGYYAKPAFADLDNDGDLDVFVGNGDGFVRFFLNTGTNLVAEFIEQTGADNPMDGVDVGYEAAPALADIDNDGDVDIFLGESYGSIRYFENTQLSSTSELTDNTQVSAVYPNPAKAGMVNINYLATQTEELHLRIVDVSGKSVRSQIQSLFEGNNTLQINTSGLNVGMYVVEMDTLEGRVVRKFVVE